MKSEENKTNNKATIDLGEILNKIRDRKFAQLADDQFFSSLFEKYKKEEILKEYSQFCSEARKNFREFLNKNKDIDFLNIRNPSAFTTNSIKNFLTAAPNLCDRFDTYILLSVISDQIIKAPTTWNLDLKSSLFSQLFPYLKEKEYFKSYIIEIIKNKDLLRFAYENQLLTQELIVDTLKDVKDKMDKKEFKRLVEGSIQSFSPGSMNYFNFNILLFKNGFNAFEFPMENTFKNILLIQMVKDKFYAPLDYIENERFLELLKNCTVEILNGFSKISESTQKKLVTLLKEYKTINLSGVSDTDSIKVILRKDFSLYDRFNSGILRALFKEDEAFLLEMIKAKGDVEKLFEEGSNKILQSFLKMKSDTQEKIVAVIKKNKDAKFLGLTDTDSIKAILRKDFSLYDRFNSDTLLTIIKKDEAFLLEMIKAKGDVGKLFEEHLNEILQMFLQMKPETQKKLVEWIAENKNIKLSDVSDKNIIKAILAINSSLFERLELKTLQEIDLNDNQFFKDFPDIIENIRPKIVINVNKEINEKSFIPETNILDESRGPECWPDNYKLPLEEPQIISEKNDSQENIISNIEENHFTSPTESTKNNDDQFLKNLSETIQKVTKKGTGTSKSFKFAVLSEKDFESLQNTDKPHGNTPVVTAKNGIYFYEPNFTSSNKEKGIASQNQAESQVQNQNDNNTFISSTKK